MDYSSRSSRETPIIAGIRHNRATGGVSRGIPGSGQTYNLQGMDDMDNGEDFAGGDGAERTIRINGEISEEIAEKFALILNRVAEAPGEIHPDAQDDETDDTQERIIRLTGDISEESAEAFIIKLHRIAASPGNIYVIISSDGGDIESGMRIIDALNIAKTKSCTICTIVARAYSMAAFIACIGDVRTMYQHGRLMFHPGRYEGYEEEMTAATLKSMHDELTISDNTFRTILHGVGVSQSLIDTMMSRDVYMGLEDAIANGIINSQETNVI